MWARRPAQRRAAHDVRREIAIIETFSTDLFVSGASLGVHCPPPSSPPASCYRVLRCLRPDQLKYPAATSLVSETLGRRFVEPLAFDLAGLWHGSDCRTPLVLVLSPGAGDSGCCGSGGSSGDPTAAVRSLAAKQGRRVAVCALGRDRGGCAAAAVQRGRDTGAWVVLQNCHLAPGWLPELQARVCLFRVPLFIPFHSALCR